MLITEVINSDLQHDTDKLSTSDLANFFDVSMVQNFKITSWKLAQLAYS